MASRILTAADEVIAQLTALSANSSNWSAGVVSAYGDWADTTPPEISYDSVIERKDLVADRLSVYVGFNFRELYPNAHDRCSMDHIYPIGVGVYQRFRAPGTESPTGVNHKVTRSVIDLFLQFTEELQDLLYSNNLTSFNSHSVVEAAFDHEAIAKQYLKSVMVVNYEAKQ